MKIKKKLLIVNPIPIWGGSSVALLSVLNALNLSGKYRFVILFNSFGLAFDKFGEAGYECHVVSFPTIGRAGGNKIKITGLIKFLFLFFKSAPKLSAFIKEGKFDSAYLNTGVCLSPALICKYFHVPIIWHIRELLDSQSLLGSWHSSLMYKLSRIIIANSASSSSAFGSLPKVQIIYDGISEDYAYSVSIEEQRQIKAKWKFAENTFVVGLIAAISWSKGHFVLLQALSKLVKTFPMLRIVFIGGSVTPANYNMTIRARIKKLFDRYSDAEEFLKAKVNQMHLSDHVIFDSWQTGRELIKRIHSLDVVAFPSTIPEGFGRPVVEAAMAAKPAIGTNVGSLPELIQHGYSGWLVPINDVDQLAQCLVEVVTNPDHTRIMGERARTIALQKFTMAIHDKKIIEVFDTICHQEAYV